MPRKVTLVIVICYRRYFLCAASGQEDMIEVADRILGTLETVVNDGYRNYP
jgi:anaerobic ribonucleoside-triphosphate reductase